MNDDERRALFRTLTNSEYMDIMNVCANLPFVKMTVRSEGMFLYTCTLYIKNSSEAIYIRV